MKTIKLLSVMTAIFCALAFLSCSKGDTGAQGPSGTNGTNGTNGVANINDTIYTIPTSAWSAGAGYFYVSFTDNQLTNETKDGVEVFFSTDNLNWQGLPESYAIVSGDNLQYYYSYRFVAINYWYSSKPSVILYVKVVVIPPAAIIIHPKTNWNNYSEVQEVINSQKNTTK